MTAVGQLSGWEWDASLGSVAVDVTVKVTLDATGNSVSRGQRTSTFSSPYFRSHSRSVGTSADASPSGSIIVGGINLLDGLTYVFGTVATSNDGYVSFWTP